MNLYGESKLSASDRGVLIIKWVGNSWKNIKTPLKDTIMRSFLKCGIFNKLDRSKGHLINIRGLEYYKILAPD